MFRQSGSAPPSEVLVTGGGSGPGSDVNLTEVGGASIALGQTTMAASLPVVIASDQSAIPITGSITATNPSVAATGAAVPADATYVGLNVGGTLTGLVAGHGTAAGALRVELPTDGTGVLATVGAVTAITNALPAGTNVIGHVITDTGSTTAVTGNVTVVQGTATSLKSQAEAYQGGTAVGAANPLQVSLANTGANATAVKVDGTGGSFPISGTITANQGTSPWVVGQATASSLNATVVGTGTFVTQSAITAASGSISSGAVSSGAFASGSIASGAVASGAFASGAIADGAQVTLGAKADAKSTATDTTAVSVMSVLKEISFMAQTPAALPANQSVNVAQINATTPLMGAGNTGTGSLRVTIATDQLVLPVGGNVAAAASDSGNPIKTGGKAASAAPSAVTAGQRVDGLYDLWGRAHMRTGQQAPVASTFTQIHVPATNVQATKTQSSAGSGKRNVCTGFTFTLTAGASAITAAAPLIVSVIDGNSGGSTYLWRSYINVPATAATQVSIQRSGIWLVGSQATGLTVEFSAAGGTNSYESVAMDGVVVEE